MVTKYDIVIIGAGLVGLATAYKIQQLYPEKTVLILEKEGEVAYHQSGKNSGVIHSGIYYTPGSHKAALCRRGYYELLSFCTSNYIPYQLTGKLIVATEESELKTLYELEQRARHNNIQKCQLIDQDYIKNIEPYLKGIKALYVPETGVVDYTLVAKKLAFCCIKKGLTLSLFDQVHSIQTVGVSKIIQTDTMEVETSLLINCAGLYSDRIARMDHVGLKYAIIPFRGEFYRLKDTYGHLINTSIYPVPDLKLPFLGIHLTKRIDNHIECGPNAVLAFNREGYHKWSFRWQDFKEMLSYSGFYHFCRHYYKPALQEIQKSLSKKVFVDSLKKFVPDVTEDMLMTSYTGVRAQLVDPQGHLVNDFVISQTSNSIHVLNAPSPAATSSLAIGEDIAGKVKEYYSLRA